MPDVLYVMKFVSEIIDKTLRVDERDSSSQRALRLIVLTVIIRQCASKIIELVR